MSKSNFKLGLNKQVVSKLNEKEIVGGRLDLANGSDFICWKSDRPGECGWSYWTNSNDNPR